jgi:aspartate/methionine/tyrosine aminotransferase
MIKCSRDLYDEIFSLHTAYLLNVSPFVLNLVTSYLRDSERDNLASVSTLLERNRSVALKALDGSILNYQEPKAKVSVSWFEIVDPKLSATELQDSLEPHGVYVLPGTHFFWHEPGRGERFIRIALARNTEIFEPSVRKIEHMVKRFSSRSC